LAFAFRWFAPNLAVRPIIAIGAAQKRRLRLGFYALRDDPQIWRLTERNHCGGDGVVAFTGEKTVGERLVDLQLGGRKVVQRVEA
jgi:formylmethanofuran dehydrogenase subunit E